MSHFIGHEPCPNCGSRDNLGVWSDGHKWCFGCGFYIPRSEVERVRELEKLQHNKNKEGKKNHVILPSDYTHCLPDIALTWLKKYGLTDLEIVNNHIGWSESNGYLIYPCFDRYGNLLCYQGRYFTKNRGFFTAGKIEQVYHILGDVPDYPDTICLVEDTISCVKVARHALCMALWGSQISAERIVTLSSRFRHLKIWLDKDKAKYAIKRGQIAQAFFDSVKVIITDKDPKDYNDRQLQDYLG